MMFTFFVLHSSTIRYDTRNSVCDDYYSLWLGQKMAFGDVFTCTSPMLKYICSSCYFQLLLNVKETSRIPNIHYPRTFGVANRPWRPFRIINSPESGLEWANRQQIRIVTRSSRRLKKFALGLMRSTEYSKSMIISGTILTPLLVNPCGAPSKF